MNKPYTFYFVFLLAGLSWMTSLLKPFDPAALTQQETGFVLALQPVNTRSATFPITLQPNAVTVNDADNTFCGGTLDVADIVISEGADGDFTEQNFELVLAGPGAADYDFVADAIDVTKTGDNVSIGEFSVNATTIEVEIGAPGDPSLDIITISDIQIVAVVDNPRNAFIRLESGALGLGTGVNFATINANTLSVTQTAPVGGVCGSQPITLSAAFNSNFPNADIGVLLIWEGFLNEIDLRTSTAFTVTVGGENTKNITITPESSVDWIAGDRLVVRYDDGNCNLEDEVTLTSSFGDNAVVRVFTDPTDPSVQSFTGNDLFTFTLPRGGATTATFEIVVNNTTLTAGEDYTLVQGSSSTDEVAPVLRMDGTGYDFPTDQDNFFSFRLSGQGCTDIRVPISISSSRPSQLVGITNSTVCDNDDRTQIPISWVEANRIGDVTEITGSPTINNISPIGGNVTDGYYINMGYVTGTNQTSFGVDIFFQITNAAGDTVYEGRVFERVRIQRAFTPNITLVGGAALQEAYCAEDASIQLLGDIGDAEVGTEGVRFFEVERIRANGNINPIRFEVPATGEPNYTINFVNGAPNDIDSDENGITLPPNAVGESYRISYDFVTDGGCTYSNESAPFVVNPKPAAPRDPTDPIEIRYCIDGDPLPLVNLLEIEGVSLDAANRVVWSTINDIPIDTIAFDEPYLPRIVSSISSGTYDFKVQQLSAVGCLGFATDVRILVSSFPNPDFFFQEACVGQPIDFVNEAVRGDNNVNSEITQWVWDFDNEAPPVVITKAAGAPDPVIDRTITYNTPGIYEVTLTASSAIGCDSTITKRVAVYPTPEINNEAGYVATFETDGEGWISSGQIGEGNGLARNSDWERTEITDTTVAEGMIGVWRNNYEDNQNSWLESPCIDLTSIDNPFMNMRIRYDLEAGADGVVMQVGIDRDSLINGETRRVTVWERLGGLDAGLNWHNRANIIGFPTDVNYPAQDPFRIGWSDSTGWVEASLDLATVKERANGDPVRFRLFFGSNADNIGEKGEGFFLDQFEVLNRERVVLIEHFSNLQAEVTQDLLLEDFLNANRGDVNVVDLRYHTVWPVRDEVTQFAQSYPPNAARALHYGADSPPQTVIDGSLVNLAGERFSSWSDTTETYYGQRILVKNLFDIVITPPTGATAGNPATLEATITRNSVGDSILIPNAVLVQMAVVEKQAEYGGRMLYNLVRQMLPTAAGTRFEQTWNEGDQVTVQNTFQPYKDIGDGEYMLVVFVADEQTKEIYQSAFVDLPASVGIPNAEGLAERFEQVTLFPNPTSSLTNGRFTVAIPAALTREQQWTVYDMLGKPYLRGTWPLNTWEVQIDASRLAEGTYIFQMEEIKKFFVVMRD